VTGRLVVPETASKTKGRCHGDGESHKNAHGVSIVLLSTNPNG
jgi:hypothetical protein